MIGGVEKLFVVTQHESNFAARPVMQCSQCKYLRLHWWSDDRKDGHMLAAFECKSDKRSRTYIKSDGDLPCGKLKNGVPPGFVLRRDMNMRT